MTVTKEVSLVRFDGNDSTTVFPYEFQVDLTIDFVVVLAVTATEDETILVNGVDYSVTGIGGDETGGNVTYPLTGDPLATGETLTIYRDPQLLQSTDLQSQGPYFAEVQETALDILVRQIQSHQNALDRTYKVPVSDGTDPDHTDIVSNTTHREGDGSDHADVATNTTHTEGSGSDHADVATNTTHGGLTDNPHSVTKTQVGLTDVADILDKLDATQAPTVDNDVDEGYSVGSQWFDETNDKAYACLDNTDGAAVWTETTGGSGASQSSDLSDFGVTTPTDGNVFRADGDSWESAILAHSDITAGDGSDHADVATNTTHTEGNGSDHADVATNTTHGGLTDDPHSTVSDADPPTLTEAFSGAHTFDYLEFFNGTIEQTIDIDIVEAAGTVSLELQAEGGGDLTLNFSDGHHAFDATDPVASVVLTNGDDEVPVKNYVYILQSNDTLTASTVGWPDAEHAPVATVVVQSAASVASMGAYAVQAWTDHIKDANDQGHQTDIADWIRGQHATWRSGVEPTLTITVIGGSDTVIVTTTLGKVHQLHIHDFPAFTGTPTIYVYNDNAQPYKPLTDLNQLDADSTGAAFTNNDYFAITLWGYVSENAAECKLYLNLPSGVYGNAATLRLDPSNFANTNIPIIYKGGAFLIAQYLMRYQTSDGGTFTLINEIDLRGQPPGTMTGGGAGAGSPLTIEEQDASPNIPDVNTIKFSNGAVTDNGGGIVSVSISYSVGTSFPSNPDEGDLFYHRTHKTLFQFENAIWNPIINYGDPTLDLYVDAGAGSDAVGQGYGSGADATATFPYVWASCIPATFTGTITIHVAAGTYTNNWVLAGKVKGSAIANITVIGTLINQASGTASAGSTTTLTDAGETWATNEFQYDLLRITGGTGSGQVVWIESSTDTEILTFAGVVAPALDNTSEYSIDQIGTIINPASGIAINVLGMKGLTLQNLKSTDCTKFIEILENSSVNLTACQASGAGVTKPAFAVLGAEIIDATAIFCDNVNLIGMSVEQMSRVQRLTSSYFRTCGHNGLRVWGNSYVSADRNLWDGNATYGVNIDRMSLFRGEATNYMINEDTAIFADNMSCGIGVQATTWGTGGDINTLDLDPIGEGNNNSNCS